MIVDPEEFIRDQFLCEFPDKIHTDASTLMYQLHEKFNHYLHTDKTPDWNGIKEALIGYGYGVMMEATSLDTTSSLKSTSTTTLLTTNTLAKDAA